MVTKLPSISTASTQSPTLTSSSKSSKGTVTKPSGPSPLKSTKVMAKPGQTATHRVQPVHSSPITSGRPNIWSPLILIMSLGQICIQGSHGISCTHLMMGKTPDFGVFISRGYVLPGLLLRISHLLCHSTGTDTSFFRD